MFSLSLSLLGRIFINLFRAYLLRLRVQAGSYLSIPSDLSSSSSSNRGLIDQRTEPDSVSLLSPISLSPLELVSSLIRLRLPLDLAGLDNPLVVAAHEVFKF